MSALAPELATLPTFSAQELMAKWQALRAGVSGIG
jgi:hypothetical protein